MTINQLKGFVAEEIGRFHMEKLEYNVVPIGREKIVFGRLNSLN